MIWLVCFILSLEMFSHSGLFSFLWHSDCCMFLGVCVCMEKNMFVSLPALIITLLLSCIAQILMVDILVGTVWLRCFWIENSLFWEVTEVTYDWRTIIATWAMPCKNSGTFHSYVCNIRKRSHALLWVCGQYRFVGCSSKETDKTRRHIWFVGFCVAISDWRQS